MPNWIGTSTYISQYTSNRMQLYTVYLYLETALHVSGGTSNHHQERMQRYVQHLLLVIPLLLPAAIVEVLELQGVPTPPRYYVITVQIHIRTFSVHGSVHSIYIYIYIYIQQDANLHGLFISGNCSKCFAWYLNPSSGAHTTVSTASVFFTPLLLSWKCWNCVPTLPRQQQAAVTV